MADDLIHPDDRPDPAARFRADLADLLDGLPDPVTVDLIAALADRGPAHARLPDTWPGLLTATSCGGGRSARWSPTGAPAHHPAPPWPTGCAHPPPGCCAQAGPGR